MGFNKFPSKEFVKYSIKSNIISPGIFPGDDTSLHDETKLQALFEKNPMRRLGLGTDISEMVAYLCSDDGKFVNGQMLQFNGRSPVQL